MTGQETQIVPHANVVALIKLLGEADAVSVDDSPENTNWETSPATGDPDNEVVSFAWKLDGCDWSVTLTEGGIAEGQWVGTSFFCDDAEGEQTQVSLFKKVPLHP